MADGSLHGLDLYDIAGATPWSGQRTAGRTERCAAPSPSTSPEAVLPGLSPAALVETAEGPRSAGTLRPGDRIITRDRGFQRLCWVGRCGIGREGMAFRPDLAPVRLSRDAFGAQLPVQELILAPQQRLLLRDARARRLCGAAEVLVAARDLVGRPGITRVRGRLEAVLLAFDSPALIRADGLWVDTLRPDPRAMAALCPADRAILAALDLPAAMPPARPALHPCAVRALFAD